jgi:hypothetical protein
MAMRNEELGYTTGARAKAQSRTIPETRAEICSLDTDWHHMTLPGKSLDDRLVTGGYRSNAADAQRRLDRVLVDGRGT